MHARGCIELSGRVQGVGFRPFVYRIAHGARPDGLGAQRRRRGLIHVEGPPATSPASRRRCSPMRRPWRGRVSRSRARSAVGGRSTISASRRASAAEAADIHLPPDLFCCDDCLAEMQRSGRAALSLSLHQLHAVRAALHDHRGLPYDRPNTSMAGFRTLPGLPGRIRKPARPPLSRPAAGLSRLRAASFRFHGKRPQPCRRRGRARGGGRLSCAMAASSRSRASAAII